MSDTNKTDDGTMGCVFWLGLIALSVGVDVAVGDGWGLVTFGGSSVAIVLLYAWVKRSSGRGGEVAP